MIASNFRCAVAAALGAGLIVCVTPGVARAAMPVTQQKAPESAVIQVWGGCGLYGHRGPWGGCRRGGQWGGYGYGSRPYYYGPRPYYGPRYWRPRRYW